MIRGLLAAIMSQVGEIKTKVLLHFNGSDASTTFTDEAGRTWTAHGNAQLDTAQYKFSIASGLFDGFGDYIDTPDSDDFALSNGDFTIDFWVKRNAYNAYHMICGQNDSAASAATISFVIYFTNTNKIEAYIVTGTTYKTVTGTTAITDSNWHHVALVRYGSALRLYIDGTQEGGDISVSGVTVNNSANKLSIGRAGEYNSQYFNGWIDEFRFTPGLARWTSNFTPPTAEYTLD